jgi:hypothetical protein
MSTTVYLVGITAVNVMYVYCITDLHTLIERHAKKQHIMQASVRAAARRMTSV